MATTIRTHPLDDAQSTNCLLDEEYNDGEYFSEVLRLESGTTEDALDAALARQASALGIKIEPTDNLQHGHSSVCESTATAVSGHVRTGSSGSLDSISTGMTSPRSSDDNTSNRPNSLKGGLRRSTSFTEYEGFLTRANITMAMELPVPGDPAPSLISVSTRRSMISIRNGIRSRFATRKVKSPRHNVE